MFTLRSTALLLLLLAACGEGGGSGSPAAPLEAPPSATPPPEESPPAAPIDVPRISRTFETSWDSFPNPERGYYQLIDLVDGRDFSALRRKGLTLGIATVSLSSYRSAPIPASFLDRLEAGFRAVRAAGIKVILRFLYADSSGASDAPKSVILGHIGQLGPVFRAHADVTAVVQAGFIGAWGEWHTSSNGLDNPVDRGEILRALLKEVPASRFIQIRTPYFKQEILGDAPLAPDEAFTGSSRARVGHHNDAFLASPTDLGTYLGDIEGLKTYVEREGLYVPVGGECDRYNPPRTDGPNALWEMKRFHYSFVSGTYKASVIDAWRQQGYYDAIGRDLGYRLSLVEASWPVSVKPGGTFDLEVRLKNSGCASLYNARPAYAVLDGPGGWHAAFLPAVDPRRWKADRESGVSARLRLPGTLAPGLYRLKLWLPDEAPALRDRVEHAVRLANAGVWDGTGANVLTDQFVVDPAAPGPADPSAPDFEAIP